MHFPMLQRRIFGIDFGNGNDDVSIGSDLIFAILLMDGASPSSSLSGMENTSCNQNEWIVKLLTNYCALQH